MEIDNIKISVLFLTFNQAQYIKETIKSCLNQNPLPFEIIISDDCSTDGTVEIIMSFQANYPNIIKPIFNKQNLGIYNNLNNAIRYVQGDLLISIGGDDLLAPNAIKSIYNILKKEENVDIESLCIIGNESQLLKNGTYKIMDHYKIKDLVPFKVAIRDISFLRAGRALSVQLAKNIQPYCQYGIVADGERELRIAHNVKKYIFIDDLISIYRIGSGITSKLNMKQYSESMKTYIDTINPSNYPEMDKKDIRFIKYKKSYINYFCSKTYFELIKNYFIMLYYTIINFNNFSYNTSFVRKIRYLIPFYSNISLKIKKNTKGLLLTLLSK